MQGIIACQYQKAREGHSLPALFFAHMAKIFIFADEIASLGLCTKKVILFAVKR